MPGGSWTGGAAGGCAAAAGGAVSLDGAAARAAGVDGALAAGSLRCALGSCVSAGACGRSSHSTASASASTTAIGHRRCRCLRGEGRGIGRNHMLYWPMQVPGASYTQWLLSWKPWVLT